MYYGVVAFIPAATGFNNILRVRPGVFPFKQNFSDPLILNRKGTAIFHWLYRFSGTDMKKYTLLLLCCYALAAAAQKKGLDSTQAPVNVTVTDMQGKPRKGEEVVIHGEKSGVDFINYTDQTGHIHFQLPPGDNYRVSVKSVNDTSKYTLLQVPALEADEYFTDPFWVNVRFDPPRHYKLDHVYFDTDKATLRPDSYPQLKELVEYLQHHDDIRIEIAGHTDNAGTPAHNQQLSENRAGAIRNYLLQKGIGANRITARGYGATQPVADNSTEAGRQLNRRTEVHVL